MSTSTNHGVPLSDGSHELLSDLVRDERESIGEGIISGDTAQFLAEMRRGARLLLLMEAIALGELSGDRIDYAYDLVTEHRAAAVENLESTDIELRRYLSGEEGRGYGYATAAEEQAAFEQEAAQQRFEIARSDTFLLTLIGD